MARTRISAAVAAFALIGVSVFAGAGPAWAAPPAPDLNLTGGWTSDNSAPYISGRVDHLAGNDLTVEVTIVSNGTPSVYCVDTLDYTDPLQVDAPFECLGAAPMPLGTNEFYAVVWETATPADPSPASASTFYYVGGIQPTVITSPAPEADSRDATPTFTGTGPSLGSVTVSEGATTLCTSDVALDGSWSCTSIPLDAGNLLGVPVVHPISAVGTPLNGTPQAPVTQNVNMYVPDAATLDYYYSGTPPWETGNPTPWMQGSLPLDTVSVIVWIEVAPNTWAHYCEAATDPLATVWFCNSPSRELLPGTNTLAATSVNEYGNLSTFGNEITVEKVENPYFTAPTPANNSYSNDNTVNVSGVAPFGTDLVIFYAAEGTFCDTVTIAADDTFSCESGPLADGTYNFYAYVYQGRDVRSQTSTVTIDTTAPGAPVILTTGTTDDSTPTISGTGEINTTITVYLNGEPVTCVTAADTDVEGNWSCEIDTPLAPGVYAITAVQTDLAGNQSNAGVPSGSSSLEIITPPTPSAPVITSPTGGTSLLTFQTVTGTVASPFAQGVLVRVTATDGESATTCDTVVPFDGSDWSCDFFPPRGEISYSAVAYINDEVLGAPGPVSNIVTVTYLSVAKPTVGYALGAASVGITSTGVPNSEVVVEFYLVDTAGPEGWSYGSPLGTCPADAGGEGPFGSLSPVSCSFASLAPGIYNVYSAQRFGGSQSEYQNDYVLIPQTPTFGATVTDSTVQLSGSGTPGYRVFVQDNVGNNLCAATVTGAGAWSCSVDLGEGSYTIRAVQQSQGFVADTGNPGDVPDLSFNGFSAYTAPAVVTITTPLISETPTPSPTPVPVALVWTFTAGGGEYEPGDETDLVGSGLPAGSAVSAEFHSTPVVLGSTTVAPDGTFLLHVKIPEDATAGLHHFVVTVVTPAGVSSTVEQAVTINVKPKGTADAPTKNPDAVAFTGAGAVGSERSDPAAPSSLTFSIRTVKDIVANPVIVGTAAAFGLVLLLLIAFPAELLNSTISEQYPRFSRRLPEVHTPWWDRFTDWLKRTPIVGGILITGLAAFIFGFSDPGFGFDITSLRVVLSCAIALFVVGYLASTISGAIIRRAWGLATEIELKPLGLILTVVGVFISRVIEFAPGFLIGLILGISLVGKTTVAQQAKATLVQAGVVFVLAMLGWLGYSFAVAALDPNSFVTALSFDTLVAVTAEGLTALFIGLLPFKFLDGQAVFQHSKVAWAAAYAFAAAAFVLIVVPAAWGDTSGPLWLWMAFIIGFAVVALGIYLYFRFWAPPLEEDEEAEQEKVDA